MTDYDYSASLTGGKTRAELLDGLRARLDDDRYEHCLRVEKTARELAAHYGEDVDRAGLAGLLHDYAKQVPVENYRSVIVEEGFDPELLQFNRGIWHGIVGVWFIEHELGVHDGLVLQAIRRHTTGSPRMTPLDQIIFIADFIEPARTRDTEIAAREAAQTSLDEATRIELTSTLSFLVSRRFLIFPKTILTYNAFMAKE